MHATKININTKFIFNVRNKTSFFSKRNFQKFKGHSIKKKRAYNMYISVSPVESQGQTAKICELFDLI
jgi:hypothetical protein